MGAPTVKGRARREQILYAAQTAFASRGYRGASIAAIAEDVGLSEPGLLHYFPSKGALLLETLEFHHRRTKEEAFGGAGSFADHLVSLASNHERDPGFIRLLLVLAAESTDPEHPAHDWFVARYERVRIGMERQFAADLGAGLLRENLDPAHVARQAIAMLDGLELQFLLTGGSLDIVTPLRAWLEPLYR
ncbi:TetR/AcrR family transcriptional regulator [Solirubrobacter ginsenosidimutans]|uniref:TetR/AcrR family transcriptional regulator n=1 Tax=Solirubrobacter ginsenosidimutans TaxID=490573 RepID=A0A9X3MPH1_9ACTN|nr:TetR/AcrR family transcriptional regulator [Solirubrobacter ginsenosidimutans]MDA0160264.1 TetR/AcrR family transcriptional regulator [Solirubrobacter ginsenosidimutans]